MSGSCSKAAMKVMSLSTHSSFLGLNSVPLKSSWKEVIAVSSILLIWSTLCLSTLQFSGWVLVRHLRTVVEIPGYSPAVREGISSFVCRTSLTVSARCIFNAVLDVALSDGGGGVLSGYLI